MTAICDWLPAMAGMVTQTRPDLLVLVFNGNRRTPCMLGADGQSLAGQALLAKYRRDALTAIGIAARAGAQTLLVGGPVFRTDSAQIGVGRVYADIAARLPGVDYVDAGEVVAPGDRFAERLPCQSIDRGHCDPDGMVAVRSADGIHFCPGRGAPAARARLVVGGLSLRGCDRGPGRPRPGFGLTGPARRCARWACADTGKPPAHRQPRSAGRQRHSSQYRPSRWMSSPASRGPQDAAG